MILIGTSMCHLNSRLHGPRLLRFDELPIDGAPLIIDISRPVETAGEHIADNIHSLL